jgi:hypothetical protein
MLTEALTESTQRLDVLERATMMAMLVPTVFDPLSAVSLFR